MSKFSWLEVISQEFKNLTAELHFYCKLVSILFNMRFYSEDNLIFKGVFIQIVKGI